MVRDTVCIRRRNAISQATPILDFCHPGVFFGVWPRVAAAEVFRIHLEMPTPSAADISTPFEFHGRRFNRHSTNTHPPLILAHGVMNPYGVVEKLARHFERQGFDVWIYNQPGFGQEGKVTKAVQGSAGE